METDKIQKVLANLGFGSRRQIENWLLDGRISVNGQIAKLGDRVNETDKLIVDGQAVVRPTDKAVKNTRTIVS